MIVNIVWEKGYAKGLGCRSLFGEEERHLLHVKILGQQMGHCHEESSAEQQGWKSLPMAYLLCNCFSKTQIYSPRPLSVRKGSRGVPIVCRGIRFYRVRAVTCSQSLEITEHFVGHQIEFCLLGGAQQNLWCFPLQEEPKNACGYNSRFSLFLMIKGLNGNLYYKGRYNPIPGGERKLHV